MPATLPSLSRRRFLGSLAASAGVLVLRPGLGLADGTDPDRVALLSDTHIPEKPTEAARDCNMTDRLRQVVAEVVKLDAKPACAVIDGDLAYRSGTAAEYANFAKTIQPIREAGIPLHLGLGNHDHFERFSSGLAMHRPKDRPVDGEQVLIVELPRSNLFILDSYDPKGGVAGKLGETQLKWLAASLDARRDKPAIVFAHHNLQYEPNKDGKWGGLRDSAALWPVLKERPQVKAYVFGHSHTWRLTEKDGIHLINLPAIGYPFSKTEVTGWVDARLKNEGIALEVRSLDPKHPKHGEKKELTWRKG